MTLLAEGGAAHGIVPGFLMGSLIDGETNGLPGPNADGDDLDGSADEDGWSTASPLRPGNLVDYEVTVSTSGYIQGWIDFNRDDVWSNDVEQILVDEFVTEGARVITFSVPAAAVSGSTYARFRFSSFTNIGPGLTVSDGEVEDYLVSVEAPTYDFGDAPEFPPTFKYPTLFASDGPRHLIVDGVHLGDIVDEELDGLGALLDAEGDDNSGVDDEDGVVFPGLILAGSNNVISVEVSTSGYLNVWFDQQADGDWDGPNDWSIVDEMVSAGASSHVIAVEADLDGYTYVRVRFSTEPGITYFGDAPDGEVEDYRILVTHPNTDFGDAPDSYNTSLQNDGARHRVTPPFMLGSSVDAELNSTGSLLADEDDILGGSDDEDGITFLTPISPGRVADVEILSPGFGALSAWMDFEADGSWDEPVDVIVQDPALSPGAVRRTFHVPTNAVLGYTYARFRLSDSLIASFGAAQSGEVEDYRVAIVELDHGDAPFLDVTMNAFTGAQHVIIPGFHLGSGVDAETNGQASVLADGDDLDGNDDEDGIEFLDPLSPGATVRIRAHASSNGLLQGWIDLDGDQAWEQGVEQVVTNVNVSTNETVIQFQVPGSILPFDTFARFRFSSLPDLGVSGLALDGEVEDYAVAIETPDWDMGDAPDTIGSGYPTMLPQDGARHLVVSNVMLGSSIDAEPDGQPSSVASGDDLDGNDDEDGVVFLAPLIPGSNAVVQVSVSTSGYLQAWIDYDVDQEWESTSLEQALSNQLMNAGTTNLAFLVPLSAFPGESFARFRFSSIGDLGPTGFAPDGEVEDHRVDIGAVEFDYGDLPAGYPTLVIDDGARHQVDPAVRLGASVDVEENGVPSNSADGDDLDVSGDDEDGVVFVTPLLGGQIAVVRVDVSSDGHLQCWADFNRNENLEDAGEHILDDVYLPAGQHLLPFLVPQGMSAGPLYIRFRFATSADVGVTGVAGDGEVEDYRVQVVSAPVVPPTAVCTEWSQRADLLQGIDIESWLIKLSTERREIRVADDWVADGREVKAVRWWGSYLGWQGDPDAVPASARPSGFRLTHYANLPTNESGNTFNKPGVELAHSIVPFGDVSESLYSISELSFVSSNAFEYEFEYSAELDQGWPVVDGQTYWLGVEAVYPSLIFLYRWGWCTAPISEGYGDRAVLQKRSAGFWEPMDYMPDVNDWRDITNHPSQGLGIDQAFEMMTASCPGPEIQVEQSGDSASSHALASSHDTQLNEVRADDFVGDGRQVVQIDWRGAYEGWQTSVTGNMSNPVLPPSGEEGPVGFMVALMNEDAATCLPGTVKTSAFVNSALCGEHFMLSSVQSWKAGDPVLHEYGYRIDLRDDAVAIDPFVVENGSNCWFSVQALFASDDNITNHQGWGWQLAMATQHCGSAHSQNGGVSWSTADLSAPHPRQGQPFDLVFSLGTDQLTPGVPAGPPEILTIWTSDGDIIIESIGDGGVGSHVLQYATDLVENAWFDFIEDPVPLDAPLTNFWYFAAPPASNLFFRIEQR